jgi:hypothetical protein
LRRGSGAHRRFEDSYHIVQARARPEILLVFARLLHAYVTSLVALHADVIGKPAREMRGIHDAGICSSDYCAAGASRGDV